MSLRRLIYCMPLGFLFAHAAFAQEAASVAAPAAPAGEVAPAGSTALPVEPAHRPFLPSYGAIGPSVFFSPADIQAMKSTLNKVEAILAVGGVPQGLAVEERGSQALPEGEPIPQQTPEGVTALVFPVFHVASVVYNRQGDWMLWINGQRVTPKRQLDGVQVTAVGADQVHIAWKADNWPYRIQVWNDKDTLPPQVLKMQARTGRVGIDTQTETLRAIMRPNQTLVTAIPVLVEGNHPEFAMTINASSVEGDDAQEGMGAIKAIFSGKLAQEYIDKVAKVKGDEVSRNSAIVAKPEKQENAEKAKAKEADPGIAPEPEEEPAMPAPAPKARQAAPVVNPTGSAPETLNDILNAINTTAAKRQ